MGRKILVVDDEPHLVDMVATRLRANRYEAVTAVRGGEGIEKAKREKPDLILLDVLMPDMDGYGVLSRLKEAPETKEIPVIMLTVRRWSEDIERALSAGAVDYIGKPFEPKDLLDKIQKVFKNG